MTERRLEGRLICLGVSGSIAAYKSAELARALLAEGADVQPLMTRTGMLFLGPLTLETLTRRKAMVDPLELLPDRRIAHIVAAESADAIVVAPATARWLAAMAAGLADDVITATCLASESPVVVAPAMDGEMFSHPATQANVERLRSYGYSIVEPETGPLASGATGTGRLAETARIVDAVVEALGDRPVRAPDPAARPPLDETLREPDLDGREVIITAGGTSEAIDPVRFIGNHSSGRMGVAIAAAAIARGARVTLIAGTITVPPPDGARLMEATSAEAMRQAVLTTLRGADVLVMAAAVADFKPRRPAGRKLERSDGLTLELEPTPDILAEAAGLARSQEAKGLRAPIIVGFAAETGSLDRAAAKAERKGVDLLLANDVSDPDSGFGSEMNRVTLIVPGEAPDPWPLLPKRVVADRLLDRVAALLLLRDAVPAHAR